MRPDVPIFDLKDHFEASIAVGTKTLPILVKRYSRGEMEVFEKKWTELILPPRGTAEIAGEDAVRRDADQKRFVEETIREAVTLEPGMVIDRGKDVVDGEGVLGVFHARTDVLVALMAAIYNANKLTALILKNSNSPRDSGTGSEASTQARGGERPDATATPAASSSSAESEAVTALSEETESVDELGPSGELRKVH